MDEKQPNTHTTEPSTDQTNNQPQTSNGQKHHLTSSRHEESETISRIRQKHQQIKSGKKASRQRGKRRIILWSQIVIVLFICITAGLTIRAFEMVSIKSGSSSWLDELQHGNFNLAVEKFSITASTAVSQVFSSDLSAESIMKDFNAALPHLKKAGYILIEMEVELGIPPKLIPHFYRDSDIQLDLNSTLAAIGDNNIGKALILALNEASDLQKQIEVADMQFNYIEVELGPIPALKLQYKNYYAVKKSILSK